VAGPELVAAAPVWILIAGAAHVASAS